MASTISRTDWGKQHDACWFCGWPRSGMREGRFRLETHEMLGGPLRHKSILEPACWVRGCNVCHPDVQGTPLVFQLAVKKLNDPEHYDRLKVTLMKNPNAPEFVTEAEVDTQVEILQ